MRGALLSAVVGLVAIGVVVGAGWSFLTAGLPQSSRPNRIAADAEAWLHSYPLSFDVFHADGHNFGGACMAGWYRRTGRPVPAGQLQQGSLLASSGGPIVFAPWQPPLLPMRGGFRRRLIRLVHGHPRAELPATLAVAIGCTELLSNALTAAAQTSQDLEIERAHAANQPALVLRLRLRRGRLALYLSPRNYRPLVATATINGESATARLYLTRATPSRKATFHRLLQQTGSPADQRKPA